MPAPQQSRYESDALDIAVCDVPAPVEDPREAAREGTIALLPYAQTGEADLEAEVETEAELSGEEFDEFYAWLDEREVVLEPSDVLEVEAARSAVRELGYVGEFEDAEQDDAATAETLLDVSILQDDDQDDQDEAAEASSLTLDIVVDLDQDLDQDEPAAAPERPHVDPLRVPFWSGINSFRYGLVRGLHGMGQSPLVQLLAVGTMAVCMLLLGTTMLILQNAQRVVHDLGVDTPVTVYMQPEIDPESIVALQARIAELPEVASVEHVSPEQALARLQDGLGQGDSIDAVDQDQRAQLLAGLDPSSLPHSLEIGLVDGVEPGFADALAARITGMSGVEDVSALGPWVQEVDRMLDTLRWLAFGVVVLVSLACLAIVWNTIRLGVFARRSEIDILRLVGGTKRFVRGPFVVEGVLQGVLGTALAIACLWLGFELIRPFLERGMALMFAAGSLRFFTTIELGVALAFGALIGLIGSRAAVARHA